MTKTKFLYGAAVQGIQSFIFQTNKLSEIAGASELVEQICTSLFAQVIGSNVHDLAKDTNAIVTAAGNIKYVFEDEEQCKKLVLKFPKTVMEFAPGITLSQAVVKVDGEIEKEHIDEMERRLWVQRNKPLRSFDVGLMAMNRSRKTGLPAFEYDQKKKEFRDKGIVLKNSAIGSEDKESPVYGRIVENFFGKGTKVKLALDFKKITHSKSKNYRWMAVIHADGNNMGIAIRKLANATHNLQGQKFIEVFRKFSLELDKSTVDAAKEAYDKLSKNKSFKAIYPPFRPVIIGGDDLTIVCRGDLALEFTILFLENFKKKTKENFSQLPVNIDFLKYGLTACAGIAYIKESYPFHYGYHLAETLCGEAKNAAKYGLNPEELTPSCLMFHKVQDSFVEEFKEIRERELCAGKGDNLIRFDFGPYYLESAQKKPTTEYLKKCISQLEGKDGNAIKSHLRQWLTDLHYEPKLAEQKKLRVISMNENKLKSLGLDKSENWTETREIIEKADKKIYQFTPVYDWLTIHSINQGGKKA
jgi:hypothetical protein